MTLVPLTTQLWYDGGWNDESDYHLNRSAVSIRRGIGREGSLASPTEVSGLLLENNDGRWNYKHPSSPLYRKIGRNTRLRLSVGTPFVGEATGTAVDSTSHVAPELDAPAAGMLLCAWACPDASGSGNTYTVPGSMTLAQTNFSTDVRIAVARQIIASPGLTGTRTATFSVSQDYVAASVFVPGPTAITTSSIAFVTGTIGVQIDGNPGDWWIVFMGFRDDPAVDAAVDLRPADYPMDTDGGGWILLGDSGSVQIGDALAEHIRMVAWAKRVRRTHGAHRMCVPSQIPGSDVNTVGLGVIMRIPAAEADLWLPRASVEARKIAPRRDTSGNDRVAEVHASGILGRLSASAQRPLLSPLRRYFTRAGGNVLAYWPCEDDGTQATRLEAATPGAQPGKLLYEMNPGSFDGFTGSGKVPTFGQGAMTFTVPGHTFAGAYHGSVLLSVPDDGLPDQQGLLSFLFAAGEVHRAVVRYGTGGSLRLFTYDAEGTELDSTVPISFDVDGKRFYLQLSLTNDGADLDTVMKTWDFLGIDVAPFVFQATDTFTGLNIGRVRRIDVGSGGDATGLAAGHVALAATTQITSTLDDALRGHNGETAAARIIRVCRDARVPIQFAGIAFLAPTSSLVTPQMGPQQPGTLTDVLEECEAADGGILTDLREDLALLYRPRASMYGNAAGRIGNASTFNEWLTLPPAATLDNSGGELADPWQPEPDDFLTQNQVTVSRVGGGSTTATQETGPLNTSEDPDDPDAVGLRPVRFDLELTSDLQLPDHAHWRKHLGTRDEPRLPAVGASLLKLFNQDPDLAAQVASLDSGDVLAITNPPDDFPDEDLRELVLGYNEDLARDHWRLILNCAPASPWTVAVRKDNADTPGPTDPVRRDTAGSQLNASVTTTATSMSVATTLGPIWGVTGSSNMDFPFDLNVAGEQVRVTAISGGSSPQTFTVTRSVNGIVKAHASGTAVGLWQPAVRGL